MFTEAERAALALAEEGTRLADAHQGVSDETWAEVRKHFDDDEVGTLVCAGLLDQRGQPVQRDRAQPGRLVRARHVRGPRGQLIGNLAPAGIDASRPGQCLPDGDPG